MAGARNIVIAGDYYPYKVCNSGLSVYIMVGVFTNHIYIDSTTVESYKLIDSQRKDSSIASKISRGVVGGAVAGDIGMLAGIASSPNNDVYVLLLNFKDGKQSLVEVNGEIYSAIKKYCLYMSDINAVFKNTRDVNVDGDKVNCMKRKKKHVGCISVVVVLVLAFIFRNVAIGASTLGELFPYFVMIIICIAIAVMAIMAAIGGIRSFIKSIRKK